MKRWKDKKERAHQIFLGWPLTSNEYGGLRADETGWIRDNARTATKKNREWSASLIYCLASIVEW
jgi:hypothetical protein